MLCCAAFFVRDRPSLSIASSFYLHSIHSDLGAVRPCVRSGLAQEQTSYQEGYAKVRHGVYSLPCDPSIGGWHLTLLSRLSLTAAHIMNICPCKNI